MLALTVLAAVATFVAVLGYTRTVEAQLGPRRPVVVVARDIPAYRPISADDLRVRQVPRVFLPDGAVATAEAALGKVSPLSLPAGTWLQAAQLTDPPLLRIGERAVTLASDGEMSLARSLKVGDVVDVVAAYDRPQQRTTVEAKDARVIAVSYPAKGDKSWVTLAVTEEETLALAKARASAQAVFVGRVPETEVTG